MTGTCHSINRFSIITTRHSDVVVSTIGRVFQTRMNSPSWTEHRPKYSISLCLPANLQRPSFSASSSCSNVQHSPVLDPRSHPRHHPASSSSPSVVRDRCASFYWYFCPLSVDCQPSFSSRSKDWALLVPFASSEAGLMMGQLTRCQEPLGAEILLQSMLIHH